MHVRMTTIRGDASKLQAAVDAVERARAVIEAAPGNKGVAAVTGADGVLIGLSYWESAEAEAASRRSLAALRDEAAATAGGTASVEVYELAVARRISVPAPGALARIVRVHTDPARLDGAIAHYRDRVLPLLLDLPGLCSVQLLVDRASGKAVGISGWEDEVAAEKALHALDEVRAEAEAAIGAPVAEPEVYTLVRTTAQLD